MILLVLTYTIFIYFTNKLGLKINLNNKSPYFNLDKSSFWKTGVLLEKPFKINKIYNKKFDIFPSTRIATAGSCFAQHITKYLKKNGYNFLDEELAPPGLPEALHKEYGFSMYSARYGNIYTVKQLLQLAKEAYGIKKPKNYIWEKDGKFYDALRPSIDPDGFTSKEDVIENRIFHIKKVKNIFNKFDVFIFTLGLTEMWIDKKSGTVYPSSPGTIAGHYDPEVFEFKNASFNEIISDFYDFINILKQERKDSSFKFILTVSPVPLTATYCKRHILMSNTASKSILRAAADELSNNENIDYFPSYEIITNPKLKSEGFNDNLRTVKSEIVEKVLKLFSNAHPPLRNSKLQHKTDKKNITSLEDLSEIQCEEELLEAFDK